MLISVSESNPTDTYFNLRLVTLNIIDKVSIKVFDVNNKLVHFADIKPNQDYRFGEDLEGAVYIVWVIQGDNIKSVRLVKF